MAFKATTSLKDDLDDINITEIFIDASDLKVIVHFDAPEHIPPGTRFKSANTFYIHEVLEGTEKVEELQRTNRDLLKQIEKLQHEFETAQNKLNYIREVVGLQTK